jgi:hypothetical protein
VIHQNFSITKVIPGIYNATLFDTASGLSVSRIASNPEQARILKPELAKELSKLNMLFSA